MLTMTADLISVASLISIFIVLCCVVKIYSAVMADYERRQGFPARFPVQEIGDCGVAADRKLGGQRGRLSINQRTKNRARPREHDERRC